jgi:hypothetical protein
MSNKGLARRIIAMAAARGIAGVRCDRTSVGAAAANRFAAWHREHARDVKVEGARLLLRMAAADDPALRSAHPGDKPTRHPRTRHIEASALGNRGTAYDADWV